LDKGINDQIKNRREFAGRALFSPAPGGPIRSELWPPAAANFLFPYRSDLLPPEH
jgi:hypothetical protein